MAKQHRIDFKKLRDEIRIEQVCDWLGIALKKSSAQARGACPICRHESSRCLVVTPALNRFPSAADGVGFAAIAEKVHALGLKTAQGLTFTESFYWDLNDKTREWSKRFQKLSPKGSMPSMTVAGLYAEILHYLKAMEALGGNPRDGAKVVAKMKELPTDDPLFGKGPLRADGRRLIPAYLFEVKKPEESKGPWDYYKLIATIAPEDAAKPLESSDCPLLKK